MNALIGLATFAVILIVALVLTFWHERITARRHMREAMSETRRAFRGHVPPRPLPPGRAGKKSAA